MGFFDRLTGANIEKNLAQYSEVYGEILLGYVPRNRTTSSAHPGKRRTHARGACTVWTDTRPNGQAVTKAETHSENASRFCEAAKEISGRFRGWDSKAIQRRAR